MPSVGEDSTMQYSGPAIVAFGQTFNMTVDLSPFDSLRAKFRDAFTWLVTLGFFLLSLRTIRKGIS